MRGFARLTITALVLAVGCGDSRPVVADGSVDASSDCQPPWTLCGSVCANTSTDPDNCGMCGNACPQGVSCATGACGIPCAEECNGACVDLNTDANNCGACGNVCNSAAGFICNAGKCRCLGGVDCSGKCVDVNTDPENCGACGIECGFKTCMGQVTRNGCHLGVCDMCPFCDCAGSCVDTGGDVSNCGGCGIKCCPGAVCMTGACTASCPAPQTACGSFTEPACDGTCVDMQTSNDHCGACGNACPSGQTCVAGTCEP